MDKNKKEQEKIRELLNFPDRKKNLVKYNNDLNDNKQYYGVSSLSKYEMDIFFFLIAQLQGQDGAVVDIKIKDLKRYLHMPTTMSYRTFQRIVIQTFDHLENIKTGFLKTDEENREYLQLKPIFDYTNIYTDSLDVEVKVNKEYRYLFNGLIRSTDPSMQIRYTRFDLQQMIKIKRQNSKNLYRLLMQNMYRGEREFTENEIYEQLGLFTVRKGKKAKKYENGKLYNRVLKPALVDLSPFFRNLRLKKQYGPNHTIDKYHFYWVKEPARVSRLIYNPEDADIRAVVNIKTNDHLTLKEKNEAIDRYFGQKIGTSHLEKQEGNKKYLKSFFEDTPFNQSGLDIEQKKLTDVELKNMISTYRYLESLNLLKDRDKTFLKLLNTEQHRREGKLEEENIDKGTFLQSFLNEPKPLESMTDVELNHYQDMLLAKIADPEHNITNSERTDLSNIRKILLGLNDLKKNMPSSDK